MKKITLLFDVAALIALIVYAFVENDIVDWICITIFFLSICCEAVYRLWLKNKT